MTARVDITPWAVEERVTKTGELVRSGWYAREIATYLGVTRRTVERYRQRLQSGSGR